MYKYSLVYVLVDDCTLTYYNLLMKSVLSVRLHMPDISINVLIDKDTVIFLDETKTELYNYAYLKIISVPDGYDPKEKSRYLKVNARKLIEGDFLYLDTDTVVCRPFPFVISHKSFAVALDQNTTFDMVHNPNTYKINEKLNILDVSNLKHYFNSGVIWVKDDEFGHTIFSHWYKKWEETRKPNVYYDQPALNYVLLNNIEEYKFGMLENEWNVQVSGSCNSGIRYLIDSYIIHYFVVPDCTFLLGESEYLRLPYNDERILQIIKDPLRAFGVLRLVHHKPVLRDVYKQRELENVIKKNIENSFQYKILKKIYFKPRLFNVNERCIAFVIKSIRILIKNK